MKQIQAFDEPDQKPSGTAQGRPRVLRLAVPVPLYQAFDYAPPSPATGQRVPNWLGHRFEVKFGRRTLLGICVDVDPDDPHDTLKPAERMLDSEPLLDAESLELGRWLADYYHHPLGEVLPLLLPPTLRQPIAVDEARVSRTLLAYRRTAWSHENGDELAAAISRAPKQRALLERLAKEPATRSALVAEGFGGPTIKALETLGAVERFEIDALATPADADELQAPLTLTDEQTKALNAILATPEAFTPCLLDGITGSGKTEVYLQAIAATLERQRQALVLIPEIALTPQTQARFQRRFPNTACLHSQVADGERLRIWEGCRAGTIDVLIGTRSASLQPFAKLGLIIVDEEHDPSYKQMDGLRYSARDLAVKRAADLQLPLVLGSATPALETLRNAHSRRYRHLRLTERAGGAKLPTLKVLDIRGQSMEDGISLPLRREIERHLALGQQVLIFINRRGYAPSLLCSRCGVTVECPACERPMTYHRRPTGAGWLQCHHCGDQSLAPSACLACTHEPLTPVGVGTQRTEIVLRERFPQVPVYRIDRDTARSRKRLEAQFKAINTGQPAILVGTQILAKGHHFPNVTLVGLLNADAGFTAPDFRAGERTAQLITQVAGRAGRAAQAGEVLIQTLQPEQPLLQALVTEGYGGFAASELERRALAGLPPSSAMLLLRAEAERADEAEKLLIWLQERVGHRLGRKLGGAELLGPAPAPQPKLANRYRYHLLGLHPSRKTLHRLAKTIVEVLSGNAAKPLLRRTRWSLDIDPYDTL